MVYDLIHQILTGRIDGGFNRELTIALFRDARLMHRIIEGSKRNDQERSVHVRASRSNVRLSVPVSAKPKGVRLGYMGHLTLISEDVIGALEHFPPDLRLLAAQYAPQPEWDEYVTGRYKETKKKDTILLGGGKPVVAPGMRNGSASWKVDEADTGGVATTVPRGDEGAQDSQMKGEFRRTAKMREGSADFGAMEDDDEDFSRAGPPHVSMPPLESLLTAVLMRMWMARVSLLSTWLRRCSPRSTLSRRMRRRTTKRRTAGGWPTRRSISGLRLCPRDSTKQTGGLSVRVGLTYVCNAGEVRFRARSPILLLRIRSHHPTDNPRTAVLSRTRSTTYVHDR